MTTRLGLVVKETHTLKWISAYPFVCEQMIRSPYTQEFQLFMLTQPYTFVHGFKFIYFRLFYGGFFRDVSFDFRISILDEIGRKQLTKGKMDSLALFLIECLN